MCAEKWGYSCLPESKGSGQIWSNTTYARYLGFFCITMGSLLRLTGLHRFKMTWMKQVKLMMQYYKQLGMCFHQNHVPIESIQQERVLCPQETVPWTLWTFTESSPNKKPFTTHPNKNHMSCCCEKPACFFLPSVLSTRKNPTTQPTPPQKKVIPTSAKKLHYKEPLPLTLVDENL